MVTGQSITDLAEQLRGWLDEDERIALAVEDNSPPWRGQWKADGNHALRTYNDWVLAHRNGDEFIPGLVQHWVRHDPATVLREVAGKRQLLDEALGWEHEVVTTREETLYCGSVERPGEWPCTCGRDARVLAVLTHLAAPYQETDRG